jgi:hypothetical protein
MGITARQDPSLPRSRSALHGILVALPISAAMWTAIAVLVEVLR